MFFIILFLAGALNILGCASAALFSAAQNGDLGGVEKAIKAGADVNAKDDIGFTALLYAASNGQANVVAALLKAGASINAVDEPYDNTALMAAAATGHANVVTLLIKAGADINARDDIGFTALMNAAENGNADMVTTLLKAGADVNARGNAGNTALMNAAKNGNANIISLLLKARADVNAADKDGITALMNAAVKGHTDIAKLLIADGADVNATAKNGGTALMNAAYYGHANVAKLLIASGANVNAADESGNTALIGAGVADHADIAKLLIAAGANVNATNNQYGYGSTTALMNAAVKGHTDIAKLLIAAGANVNAVNNQFGATALILAATYGHANIVKLLIASGADLNVVDVKGGTALTWAEDENHYKVANLIKNAIAEQQAQPAQSSQASPQVIEALSNLERQVRKIGKRKAKPKARVFHSSVDRPTFKAPRNRHMFALVIGVEKYPGGLPSVQFADRDSRAVYRTLIALGVPPDHIKRLTNGTATRGGIKGGIRWLGRNAKPDSTVWVYFSGHGAPGAHGHTYLVPSGGNPNDLRDTAYRETSFYNDLNRLHAKRVLIALDACFSGRPGRSVIGKGVRALVTVVKEGSFPRTGKLIAFSAAKADQEAGPDEKTGHGLFTYYFLKGIDGGAKRAGHVTVGSLSRYLKRKVPAAASLDNNADQVPQVEPKPVGKIALVRIR